MFFASGLSALLDHARDAASPCGKGALIGELEQSKSISEEARRRAESANVAKSRFLAQMSHELRTPLNAILGFSEVVQSEIFGPHSAPAYKEYAGDIHNSGVLLLNLINEILDLSRIETRRYELNEDAASLRHMMENCHYLLKLRAGNRNIKIHEIFEPDMPRLWTDERAMRQICLNCCRTPLSPRRNAAKSGSRSAGPRPAGNV
jgi:two-component system cell cycle sensor histidine kinase PleC